MRIGYFLSCKEYSGLEVIDEAKQAEAAGFDCLWISDEDAIKTFRDNGGVGKPMPAGYKVCWSEDGANRAGTEGAGFFGFYAEQVLPRLRQLGPA